MFEKIKDNLIIKNHELKTRLNTVLIDNERLSDKRIDELLKVLARADELEEKDKQVRHLEAKVEALKEVIKELKNGKTHK
ncbi:MAG: hypothetical protein IJL74_04830 [Bacilli bacterium]|nr:hypothetical protein [Bacilli bacterium]